MAENYAGSFELASGVAPCYLVYQTETATATATPSIDSFIPCCCYSTINSTRNNGVIDFRPPPGQGLPRNPPMPSYKATAPTRTPSSVDKGACGFLNDATTTAVESPPGSERFLSSSSVITDSVFCSNCCSRLVSAKRRATLPMDYFHDKAAEAVPPRSPRHNNNSRHYRSMFLTSADNSLLSPAGDYALPRSENIDKDASLKVVPSGKPECVVGGLDKSAGQSEIDVVTKEKPPPPSLLPPTTMHMTMVSATEHKQQHQPHQHPLSHRDNPHFDGPTRTTTTAELCQQHVLSVNYNPLLQQNPEHWSGRRAGQAVVTSTITTATIEQQRTCPGCECERKIDQYISEMLIENLNNTGDTATTVNNNVREIVYQEGYQGGDAESRNNREQEERDERPTVEDTDGGYGDEEQREYEEQEDVDNDEVHLPLGDIGYQENANEQQPCRRDSYQGPPRGVETSDNVETDVGGTTDRFTYIPCYTNERNEIVLGPVHSGSVYPDVDFDTAILVPRLSAYPRSESMEVGSSASAERHPPHLTLDSAEENLSLVDSLEGSSLPNGRRIEGEHVSVQGDDPDVEKKAQAQKQMEQLRRAQSIENATTQNIERPEAFFVPIGRTKYQEDLNISKKMPPTIRERLNLRQRRRNFKREQELVRKNHANVIETRLASKVSEMRIDLGSNMAKKKRSSKANSNGSSHTMIVTKYHPAVIPLSPPTNAPPRSNGNIKSMIRDVKSDIGALKSYTIDSKGNMQFQALPPVAKGHHPVRIATRKSNVVGKSRKKGISFDHHNLQPQTHQQSVPRSKKKNQSETLTLYQSHAINLTPDADKGPRRIYQKTEIQDGEKRIEILEIVECADSSNNNSARNQSAGGSRIPRPILKIPKYFPNTPSSALTTPTTTTAATSSSATATASATASSQDPNDSDQLISDMLIENLQTDSRAPEQQPQQLPQSRRAVTGPKFSMFEVIPEEKSSAVSNESAEEEKGSSSRTAGNDIQVAPPAAVPPRKMKAFTVIMDEEESAELAPLSKLDPIKSVRGSSNVVKRASRPQQPSNASREHLARGKPATVKTGGERRGWRREQGPEQKSFTTQQHSESNYTKAHPNSGTLLIAA